MQAEEDRPGLNLTDQDHWSEVYDRRAALVPSWRPTNYENTVITGWLLDELRRGGARNALEVGCGDSIWLPFLAREAGLDYVGGIDYVASGCEMLRHRLQVEQVRGDVHCVDLFEADPRRVGQFDFVYSLGLVEHFPDLEGVLSRLRAFVRPGGTLLTEVPNLGSLHGLAVRAWQPKMMDKHVVVTRRRLLKTYRQMGFEDVRAWHAGLFSLAIVAWEVQPRWPRLAAAIVPAVRWFQQHVLQRILRRLDVRGGLPYLAPYLMASGRVPALPGELPVAKRASAA